MTPDTLERRHLQTRRFDGIEEKKILAASAGVLQDLGFNIDESETKLGLIAASKNRSAVSGGQIAVRCPGGGVDGHRGRQSTRHKDSRFPRHASSGDRNVNGRDLKLVCASDLFSGWFGNTDNQVTRIEAIDEPAIYQEFFEKLSKSAFLEAQQIMTAKHAITLVLMALALSAFGCASSTKASPGDRRERRSVAQVFSLAHSTLQILKRRCGQLSRRFKISDSSSTRRTPTSAR